MVAEQHPFPLALLVMLCCISLPVAGLRSGPMAPQLQPVQPAAGIAGHQELVGGYPGQGDDGGLSHEQHTGGTIGAAWIPQADGVV